jgi:hypothetical protein
VTDIDIAFRFNFVQFVLVLVSRNQPNRMKTVVPSPCSLLMQSSSVGPQIFLVEICPADNVFLGEARI